MSVLEAIILGIIQGLTEFLPVSSSGHIELGKAILGIKMQDPLLFSVVVHGATALSTIVVFWKTIVDLFKGVLAFEWNYSTRYLFYIILSMIPVGIVGVFFEDKVEQFFEGQILLVGLMLIVTGILLYLTEKAKERSGEITAKEAVIIGLAQAVAILPGISRSGSTIATALLLGVNRAEAARFSFLMVLPPILGATLLKAKKYYELSQGTIQDATVTADAMPVSATALIIGFIAAFISGLLACNWMIRLVKNAKLQYFAYYCLIVGIIAVTYTILQ
jgi:undecaprenyl-diphosphatase